MTRFKRSLFIFRRDLRLRDNTALIEAAKRSDEIVPVFIFDPRQAGPANQYFGANAFQFLLESIEDLEAQVAKRRGTLFSLRGEAASIVRDLIRALSIEAVFVNRDYTPFSRKRDEAIETICREEGIAFTAEDDALLTSPGSVMTTAREPYKVFTPFFRAARSLPVRRPANLDRIRVHGGEIDGAGTAAMGRGLLPRRNDRLHVSGGRSEAMRVLGRISALAGYEETRNRPADEKGTSDLSAYNKFGCVSIREVRWTIEEELGRDHGLVRQLYWRDFFTHLAWNFPHVFGQAFNRQYDEVEWDDDEEKFAAWCEGRTGFPIVDAGMRQLNETGWMHNRVRMIVASFLTKDLHIDWRMGERYFATKLVDYDPAVNNGNWQWASSTGADSQPYFRIFNPWLQQKKFDPEAEYVKRWIPELANLDRRTIHVMEKVDSPLVEGYPRPMIDHRVEKEKTILWFARHQGSDGQRPRDLSSGSLAHQPRLSASRRSRTMPKRDRR